MKVLLLEDVYNLGRAGDVKKVANGYGRNYLLPQGMAVLATRGALKQTERIREEADAQRNLLNKEFASIAEQFENIQFQFPAKAGETGKLFGSVTTKQLTEKLNEELGLDLSRKQIDSQPLRQLGMHKIKVRLTIDLIPEFSVVVYREGESPENYMVAAEDLAALTEEEVAAELKAAEAELESEDTPTAEDSETETDDAPTAEETSDTEAEVEISTEEAAEEIEQLDE